MANWKQLLLFWSAGFCHTAIMAKVRAAELRLADVEVFLNIVRDGTVNGAARSLGVSPSHVSKSAARLERYVGVKLLARSAVGVLLTDDGNRLVQHFVDLMARAQGLVEGGERRELTLVAPAFLSTAFVPRFAARLSGWRLHALEPPPQVAGAYATRALFDIALTTRDERWPGSWLRTRAGTVRRALFAAPSLAARVGPRPTRERLCQELFIGPLYSERGQPMSGDDRCPIPESFRRFGHRTQTVTVALELAVLGEQLVFAPVIAAQSFVAAGLLVEIPVAGWNVRDAVFLLCHQDRVEARVQRTLVSVLQAGLRKADQ